MKNGLLLTLKELIKLGIIKLKRRRRNKNKRLRQIEAFEKGISDAIPINIQNKRYLYPPPVSSSFQINTDPLRIREDNARLNVQLLENKINTENQQRLIDEQQLKYNQLAYDVDLGRDFLRKYGSQGFAYDDDIVVSKTEGDESFEAQTRQEPRPFIPQTVESPRYLPIQYSQDISETPRSVTEEDFVEETDEPIGLSKSETKEDFVEETDEPIRLSLQEPVPSKSETKEDFVEETDEPISLKTQTSDNKKINMTGAKILPDGRVLLRDGTVIIPDSVKDISSKLKPKLLPEGPIISKKIFKEKPKLLPEPVEETSPKLKPMNYPFNPEKIYYSNAKPSVSELNEWRQWYLTEGLNDDSVLEMNTRSGYIKPLLAKLLDDYKNLRGEKDPIILKSKDPRMVFKAIRQRLS